MIGNATMMRVTNHFRPVFRLAALLTFVAHGCLHLHAADRVPERKEIWVPSKNLDEILKKHPNAVLLDRAQYEALIRDAEKVQPGAEDQPPVKAVIESTKINVDVTSGDPFVKISAKVSVMHLVDGWVECPLLRIPHTVRALKVDGKELGAWGGDESKLAMRGKGRHEVLFEFQAFVIRQNGICRAEIPLLGRPFKVTVTPHGNVKLPVRWPVHDGAAEPPIAAENPAGGTAVISWEEKAPDTSLPQSVLYENANCITRVDGVQSLTEAWLNIESSNGPLPAVLRFELPDENTHVISVDNAGVASWKQAGAMLEITCAAGLSARHTFIVHLTRPSPEGANADALLVDVPRLVGAARISANLALGVGAGFEMKGWQTPAAAVGNNDQPGPVKAGTINGTARYEVAPEKIITIIRRAGDHFSADVDNRIALSTHEMTLERTIAFRGEEGRVNQAEFTLPANEQFIALQTTGGEPIVWKQVERSKGVSPLPDAAQGRDALATFEIIWPGGLQKDRTTTLLLKTRQDISAKANTGQGSEKLTVENVRFTGATRVAGYVALDFDESWKVATRDATGLEARDARTTPVKGKMAWFTLRDYKLELDIARNEPVLDATVIAHALPRAKQVEIEGQFTLDVTRAPLRKFDVKLPAPLAKLLRVDSPLVGEQSLDEASGVWHFTLRKELLGCAHVRFHISLPVDQAQQTEGGPEQKQLTATLPQFSLPTARRFTGQWVIEANTDTELTYATKGVQPLDATRVPQVDGYQPRHRVLAAFGYTAAQHEVKLTATRHEPSALISAVVEQMSLTSVLSSDGSSRHQAALLVKNNGQQFFSVRLPKGAQLLAAMVAGETVKPVRAGEDEVRVPLNGDAKENSAVPVKVIYELSATPWKSSGSHRLEPPAVSDGVPVLSANWRVYAPEGMEVNAKGGFGESAGMTRTPTLLGSLFKFVNWSAGVTGFKSNFRYGIAESTSAGIKVNLPINPDAALKGQINRGQSYDVDDRRSDAPQKSDKKGKKGYVSPTTKSGLISLDLTLPVTGRILEFSGHQKPEALQFTYKTWERQMSQAVVWLLLGMVAFLLFGWRRPWIRTFIMVLLLTCVPLLGTMSWLWMANAFLAGWLALFLIRLLWRIARWMEIKCEWAVAKCRGLVMPQDVRGASAWFLMFAGTALSCGQVLAEDEKPDPAAHTVIVPYDGKKPVGEQQAARYYLDYAEFQKLWELAKENRRPPKPDDLEKGVKPEAVINSALYEAEIFDDRLHVNARLNVMTRGGKWVKLPLTFQAGGLVMGEVKLDGQTAAFQDGAILIENDGAHIVEIVFDVRQSKGWRDANLTLPPSAAALLALKVPTTDGRPDFGDAAHLVTEEKKDGRRLFTLPLGAATKLSFVRSAFLQSAGDAPPAISESSITLSILPHLEKLNAQISFGFPGVERDRFSVLLDPSLKPVSWNIPYLREWTLKEENGKLRADIRLIRPVAGAFRLSLSAERVLTATEGGRSVPLIAGVAAKQTSVFHFQTSEALQSRVEATAGVQRMESAAKTSSGLLGGGAYRLQKEGKLGYTVSLAEDRSASRIESVFQVSPQKAEIIAAITLDTGRGPLLDALIGVPAGYEVQTLAGPRVQSWHRDGDQVFVRFDSQPQSEARLVLHVAKTLPKADVTWKLEPLMLPQFKKHEGTVLIAAHAADDVKLEFDGADRKLREVDPATIRAVVSVAPPLAVKRALSIEKPNWTAKVTLTRQTPKFAVDAVLLAQATDEGLKFSQQIGVLIEQGALNSVTLRMPKDLPEARVLGALVRDAQSKVVGEMRQYDVTFQADVLDRVDFSLDFELPIEGEKVLPVLQVAGASRIQDFFIVDNASSREMKTNAGGAVAAVKESLPYVPEGLLRPVFFRADEKSSVKLTFSQLESSAGNAAIVTLAEITTALRPNGERMETVVYSLANRSLQFLPVRLPADAELIEVSVGGQSVRADVGEEVKSEKGKVKSGQMYLVPLIQMRPGELSQQVRMVYRLPAREKNLAARQKLDDPELVGLSAERTLWNVWLPEKFAMKKWDGNMEEVPEVVVEDEKQMQKVSDAARLNRLLLSGNLEERDVKEAWGNANKALDEVKSYQAKKRAVAKPREMKESKAEQQQGGALRAQQALKYDAELEKQLDTQGTLLSRNGDNLNYNIKEKPQARDKSGKDANANWKGQGSGQTIVINPNNSGVVLNEGNVVNFNDNVQVDQNFLAQGNTSSSLQKTGAGTQTLSGENTYTGATTVSAGTLTVPTSPQAKGKEESIPQQQVLNTSNARASQVANPQGQVADVSASGNDATNANPPRSIPVEEKPTNRKGDTIAGFIDLNEPGARPPADGPSKSSVLNAPTVTTQSGSKATIEVIREFIYPSEFNPAQLKPVGRVSLAVQVPLEGKVYHFRKLKDHALIEVTVAKPFDERQTGAMWALGIGLAVLTLIDFLRRAWSRRRRVVAL